jgi:opacity protein-like surface antigen
MGSLKTVALAAAAMAALAPQITRAADLPPPPMIAPPAMIEEYGGWYLRGDIGMSNQRLSHLDNALFATTTGLVFLDKGGFDSAPIFGVGVGYKYNNWLRFDLTGEYRGKAGFHALDTYIFDDSGGGGSATQARTNIYTGSKSELLFLFNTYFDLGTWHSVTPFIGAGIGTSRNTISHFRDIDPTSGTTFGASVAYGATASEWDFAWALHAGLSYNVSPNFAVELAYRYLHLGDAKSGDLIAFDGTNNSNNPMLFKGLTSHDLKLGVRWMFADNYSDYRPPLVRKY